eukprot:GHRR01030558.1.p1 GENE.GHRR01030558.1~~GHRR01030558.1.p1  ORF type:complete len:199 (+),score=32.94 GHRR01030558.1:832-1428(+)
MAIAAEATMSHPYFPMNLDLPGVQPLVLPFEQVLAVFFTACGVVLAAGWYLSGRAKFLGTGERSMVCWFLCSGLIHLIVESTVVLNSRFYQDTSGNILNEIWKEYSKADSRYATRDDFIISMEAVTAFIEGPACLAVVYAMLQAWPWRHAAILMVSLGQLYGDVLYFLTCIHGGKCRRFVDTSFCLAKQQSIVTLCTL